MQRPGSALLASIVVHLVVVGGVVLALGLNPRERAPLPVTNSVPVSIISEMVVPAGPADAPSDEPAAEAPAEVAPPAPPEPTPPPPRPVPTPTPRPPTKTTPPRPTPPRPTPPRPAPPREETLNLSELAKRPNTRPPAQRPPSGERGNESAGRATGPQIQNISGQISSRWDYQCDLPGARDLVVPVTMRIAPNGRVTDGPDFTSQGSGDAWRSAIDTMRRAIAAAQPFRLPEGWTEQTLSFRFRADVVCANQ